MGKKIQSKRGIEKIKDKRELKELKATVKLLKKSK